MIQHLLIVLTTALIAAFLFATSALAAPPAAGQGKASAPVPAPSQQLLEQVITAAQRAVIEEYYRAQWDTATRTGTLPPGLAKRDRLPPGLQRQLVKNGRLPPGLDKHPLPSDLERLLGAAPAGTQRYLVGDNIILVDTRNNILLDMMRHALHPPASRR